MTAWDDIRFEWARGPFRLSTEDSLVVMARIAELEAEVGRLRAVCGAMDDPSRTSRFEYQTLAGEAAGEPVQRFVRTVTTTAWRLP